MTPNSEIIIIIFHYSIKMRHNDGKLLNDDQYKNKLITLLETFKILVHVVI